MNLIMGPIRPEQLELFALEFGKKIAEFDTVYYQTSADIDFVFNWTRTTGVIFP